MSKDDRIGGFDLHDLKKECFTLDKPLEAFNSLEYQKSSGQQSSLAEARPSCSSNSNETSNETSEFSWIREEDEFSWIREEDNREESASSFSGLGLNSQQLVHPTKARAKAPRTRRPRRNRSKNASEQDNTEITVGVEATQSSFRGKEPLGDTRQAGSRKKHSKRDAIKGSTSGIKDNIRNLIARFQKT